MAALTGNAINTSYQGLLKTTDNGALTATAKVMTDGLGNNSTLQMGTAGAIFTGTLDLTGATVTGLPAGVDSIIAGTGISVDQATGNVTVSSTLTDTTYDLAAVASGANINLNLTGSDATTDTVSIVAGTNITLSEAAGVVTIDAASGIPAGDLEVTGALDLTTVLEGVIFTASDSTRWKQTISPTGVPIYTQVV